MRTKLSAYKYPTRVFEVQVLKEFPNFKTLKTYIVISDTIPLPEDMGLKIDETILRTTQLKAEVVVK